VFDVRLSHLNISLLTYLLTYLLSYSNVLLRILMLETEEAGMEDARCRDVMV